MTDKIWLSPPHMGTLEENFVQKAFQDNWLTSAGANVEGFENDLEVFHKHKRHVVSLNSGTSAIHLALIHLGVKAEDEVICQSFTFCGSVNPVKYLGANLIFIDSEKETLNMCPITLESAIKDRISKGKKPKAIIIVHLYGMPAKMTEIIKIAKTYNIPIIEDAAEALGSTYKNQLCGTLTNYGVLSFNGNKVITTTAGGALLVKSELDKKEIIHLASQAKEDTLHYEHTKIGYNYRLSNVLAGIGRGQMQVLNSHLIKLQDNHQFYKTLCENSSNLKLFSNPNSNFKSNHWLNIVTVSDSAEFSNLDVIKHLDNLNIESRPLWKPMHLQPVFKDDVFYGEDVAESFFNKGICLPSGSNLSKQEKNRIKEALKPFLNA